MKKHYFLLLALALVFGAKTFGQEWEHSHEFAYSDDERIMYYDATELSDGSFAVNTTFSYKSGTGDFYVPHPALKLFSSDGEELAYNQFFKPAYWCSSNAPFTFENKDGELFALLAYSPDHDPTYFNYFKNYDNPPTEAIIGLYKLGDSLRIEESFETTFAIDTFEKHDDYWNFLPNGYSGNILLFSAFQDEENIVGGYVKMVSRDPQNPRGNDSIFFFKMDFEGEFLQRKGYELVSHGGNAAYIWRRCHMVKSDSGYLYYVQGNSLLTAFPNTGQRQGSMYYLDDEMNILKSSSFWHFDHSQNPSNLFYNISVKRSRHNTTFLSSCLSNLDNEELRFYEYDDSDMASPVTLLHKAIRRTGNYDMPARVTGVDLYDDNAVFFAYTLNVGINSDLDSWMMIESLDNEFDTISTMYYDLGDGVDIHSQVMSVTACKGGGVLLVFWSKNLSNTNQQWTTITKFPAEAFVGIEEAHDNGLKVAFAYPNPGNDVLNIRTGLKDAWVEVYDLSGRMVYRQDITDNITAINTTFWPAGSYVWRVMAGASTGSVIEAESGKWIKE